ncbi:MAG: hypothetical protein ACPGAJ_09125, partial [Schleiferiaceae bacterium]
RKSLDAQHQGFFMRISKIRYQLGLKPHITRRDDDHYAKDQGSIQQMKWRKSSTSSCFTSNPLFRV